MHLSVGFTFFVLRAYSFRMHKRVHLSKVGFFYLASWSACSWGCFCTQGRMQNNRKHKKAPIWGEYIISTFEAISLLSQHNSDLIPWALFSGVTARTHWHTFCTPLVRNPQGSPKPSCSLCSSSAPACQGFSRKGRIHHPPAVCLTTAGSNFS